MYRISALAYSTVVRAGFFVRGIKPDGTGRDEEIRRISLRALFELSVALASNVGVLSLYGYNFSVLFLTKTLAGLIGWSVLQGALPYHLRPFPDHILQTIARFSVIFILGEVTTLTPRLHEWGHGGLALLCFRRARPTVKVIPFKRANTEFSISYGLTPFGGWLGSERSIMWVKLGGMIGSLGSALTAFAVAGFCRDKYPVFRQWIRILGCVQLFSEAANNFNALRGNKLNIGNNDYIYLRDRHGIPPVALLAILVALPVIQSRFLS